MRMRRLAVPVAFLAVISCPTSVDDGRDTRVLPEPLARADSLVTAWVEDEWVPGAVLLVSRGDSVVLERAYGWARLFAFEEGEYGAWRDSAVRAEAIRRLPDPVPMTPGTLFDLASVTKVMATTFAAMLLVDDGVLDLDVPLHHHLTDFRGGGRDAITPRHLLTHRSGLPQWQPIYYHAGEPHAAYEHIRALPLAWGVGEGRHYSDLGFMLLGLVAERLSGRGLDALLRERLSEPLGLQHTGFRPAPGDPDGTIPLAATSHGNPFEHRMVHDTTFGYRYRGDPRAWEGWRRRTLMGEVNDGNAYHAFGGVAGHAGLFATARDLGVLLEVLLGGGSRAGTSYVRTETVDLFLQDTGDGQALGWQVPDYAPEGSFAHTGFTGTFVLGVPRDGLAVVLLTNRQNVGLDDTWAYPDLGPLRRELVTVLTAPDASTLPAPGVEEDGR